MPISHADRQKAYRERHAESRDTSRDEMLSVLYEIRDLLKLSRDSASPLNGPLRNTPPHPPKESPPLIPQVSRRGSRLPDDWGLSQEDWEFADKLGLNEDTFDSFCDFWRSKPGQAGCKLDWSATWRNWCRKDASNKRVAPKPNGHARTDVEGHTALYGDLTDPTELWEKMNR